MTELEKQTFDKANALIEKYKQIEEMAKNICHLDRTCDKCMTSFECKAMMYAKRSYEAGYRKASDVAREIFEEIEKFNRKPLPECQSVYVIKERELAELKKKYTKEERAKEMLEGI